MRLPQQSTVVALTPAAVMMRYSREPLATIARYVAAA
jgi:hypothetical protein